MNVKKDSGWICRIDAKMDSDCHPNWKPETKEEWFEWIYEHLFSESTPHDFICIATKVALKRQHLKTREDALEECVEIAKEHDKDGRTLSHVKAVLYKEFL